METIPTNNKKNKKKNKTAKRDECFDDEDELELELEFVPKQYKQCLSSHKLKLYEDIGRGHSSVVYRCRQRRYIFCSYKNYALKAISLMRGNRLNSIRFDSAMMECEIMNQISHKNICKYYSFILINDEIGGGDCYKYCLIRLEHLSCSLLDVFFGGYSLDDDQAKRLFLQLGCALRYLHNKSIAHNDIKPANIMLNLLPYGKGLDHCTYKLIDFGYARIYRDTEIQLETEILGDVTYLAPDKLDVCGYDPFLADSFNLGLTIVESFDGIHERIGRSKSTIHSMVIQSHFKKLRADYKISKSFCSILSKMLQPANMRISIDRSIAKYEIDN